jgi:hypothetical protein
MSLRRRAVFRALRRDRERRALPLPPLRAPIRLGRAALDAGACGQSATKDTSVRGPLSPTYGFLHGTQCKGGRMANQKRRRSPGASSEQGFIFPEDGLHKAMAALPWPVLRDMLFPQERKRPHVQLRLVSAEQSAGRGKPSGKR